MPEPADRLAALFDAHAVRLYRLARRLATHADASDLVQATFLKAAAKPNAVPIGASAEEAWLVRVLINIRRDQWRAEAVRKRGNDVLGRQTAEQRNPETILLDRIGIWRALDTLAPRQRAILVMYELEGLPMDAIAGALGISRITVRWYLSKARRSLARQLNIQQGGTHEQPEKSPA